MHEAAEHPVADPEPAAQPTRPRHGERDRAGRFTRGNRVALKSGRWSQAVARALLPEQRELLSTLAEREAAIVADLGGADELSTFDRDLVTLYEQLSALADYNAARMLNSRPSVRREAREAFMAAVDRKLRIIGLLGTSRRQKPVGDVNDWIAQTSSPSEEDPQP